MSAGTTIAELLQELTPGEVLEQLPVLCRRHRMVQGLSYRQAARVIGIDAHSRLYELEHGADARLSTVTAVVRWLEGWL